MTKVEMFSFINSYFSTCGLEEVIAENSEPVKVADIMDFCSHEIELLQKKRNSSSSKPSAKQIANDGFKKTILAILGEADAPMSINAIMEDSRLAGTTHNQVVALLTQLKKDNLIIRTEVKRVVYFTLA